MKKSQTEIKEGLGKSYQLIGIINKQLMPINSKIDEHRKTNKETRQTWHLSEGQINFR